MMMIVGLRPMLLDVYLYLTFWLPYDYDICLPEACETSPGPMVKKERLHTGDKSDEFSCSELDTRIGERGSCWQTYARGHWMSEIKQLTIHM